MLGRTAANSVYCLPNRLMKPLLSLCILSYFISIKCRQAGQTQNIYDQQSNGSLPHSEQQRCAYKIKQTPNIKVILKTQDLGKIKTIMVFA